MAVRVESQAEPIPGYRLIERLGGGGFGEVWKAEAPGGFHKAIKFVYGDLQDVGEDGVRAEQELKALSRVKSVRHPYILSLERFDIIDGQLMIVMELADRNLWDRFKECRSQGLPGLPRDELLGYMEETAEALDLMNIQYQLQHLDIKPQNLFLVYNHVKVADFGLVKDLEGMAASVTGGVTPVYAAPETFDGWVSRFSDQYSLAIVYQELLTGLRPFSGTNVRQLVMQHLQAKPDLSALPPEDQPIIEIALAKNPDERHPTCRAMVDALRAASVGRRSSPAPAGTASLGDADLDGDGPLTSPNRITPNFSEGNTQWLGSRDALKPAPPAAGSVAAAAEVNGDGALFPALVIGVGSQGLSVLQQLRERLVEKFGSLDALPHLRLLFLDTDPEVLRTATRGNPGVALTASEILLAQLNRPSHYLRPREGRMPIIPWFNPKMLYRIPRTQVTTGVRALGRLAFCDNHRLIARRLRAELSACLDPQALAAAARETGLGLRSNRPRVYVITGLAGGTGGGMFLDLAFSLRALLREAGHERPDVAGLFILPSVDRQRVRAMSLGNAYAALTELYHFGSPHEMFIARYDEREPQIRDLEPPFNRTMILRLPDEADAAALRKVAGEAGEFLFRDLGSSLGRAIDLARADYPGPAWEQRGLFCQTFGLYRFSWPRRAMTHRAAQRLCQRLVQKWMSKDSKLLVDPVHNFVQGQWAKCKLGPEHFHARLQASAEQYHGQSPEADFAAAIEELSRIPVPEGRAASAAPAWKPAEVRSVLQRLYDLMGKPADEVNTSRMGELAEAVQRASEELVTQWGQKLSELTVKLIEQPAFRLAGAEEALRQVIAGIERVLQEQEWVSQDLNTRAAEALQRLVALFENPNRHPSGGRRGPATPAEVVELLLGYARLRYEGLRAAQVVAAYLSLRGHLSDELREVNFCRNRLSELLQALGGAEPERGRGRDTKPADALAGTTLAGTEQAGRQLFPNGCKTMEEAVDQFLAGVTAEDLQGLDDQMQAMIRQQFTALVHVCLTSTSLMRNLEAAMMHEANSLVEGRLAATDVAEMFLAQYADEEEAKNEIITAFDEAAPDLIAGGPTGRSSVTKLCVLAVPPGPSAETFRRLVRQALADVEIVDAPSADDIILYREWPHLPLADLELFGPDGREAYRQMTSVEHFTPHTRTDIPRWHGPGADRPTGNREQGSAAR